MHHALHSNLLADSERDWPGAGAIAWQVALPLLLLWRVRLVPFPAAHTAVRRGMLVVMASAGIAAVVTLPTDAIAGLRRDPAELRYLVTPANLLALGPHTSSDPVGKRVLENPPPAINGSASLSPPLAPMGRARAFSPVLSVSPADPPRATTPRSTTKPLAAPEPP